MKIFNDCYSNSKNNRGFFQSFSETEGEKLTDLIGEYSSDDIKKLDLYTRAKIGFLNVNPLLNDIFSHVTSENELLNRQNDGVKMFIYFKYSNLLKVKKLFLAELSETNGYIKSENTNTTKEDVDTISSFNSDDFENDRKTNFDSSSDKNIIRKDTNTSKTLINISDLTDFYKMSFYDKIIDFIKDLFTLQVID